MPSAFYSSYTSVLCCNYEKFISCGTTISGSVYLLATMNFFKMAVDPLHPGHCVSFTSADTIFKKFANRAYKIENLFIRIYANYICYHYRASFSLYWEVSTGNSSFSHLPLTRFWHGARLKWNTRGHDDNEGYLVGKKVVDALQMNHMIITSTVTLERRYKKSITYMNNSFFIAKSDCRVSTVSIYSCKIENGVNSICQV